MRVAILSDIHGNRHALEAVLQAVAPSAPDRVWCLGDVVGYGAEPDACVDLIRERGHLCLAGNHDLVVCGTLPMGDFSEGAAAAARWTQATLAPERAAWLRGLEPQHLAEPVGLYHASPRDPVWEYVISAGQAEDCLDAQAHRVCLIGHSHVALSFVRAEGDRAWGQTREDGETVDLDTGAWLVNPGSVGQPRDGDPRAAWLELDTEPLRATYHRVSYDVAGAAGAIRAAGLPTSLADRLARGQ